MPANVWSLNLIVLAVLLEADLGRRKIGWFRLLRDLPQIERIFRAVRAAVTIPFTVKFRMGWNDSHIVCVPLAKLAEETGLNAVALAAFWAVIFAARLVFIYGTEHWFARPLGQFLIAHQLSATGLSGALLFMAIAMALARSVLLAIRGQAAIRHAADARRYPAAVLDHTAATR